jgi:hypothetical protein
LQVDLDFVDRAGQVVLPVASSAVLLDTKGTAAARPMANLEVTEILDERAVESGKLALEVKVTCSGLPPRFEDLFTVPASDFKIEGISDSGSAVQRLSSDTLPLSAQTERAWAVKFAYAGDRNVTSAKFRFPEPKPDNSKVTFKRYQDVDLVEVPKELAVTGIRVGRSALVPWAVSAGALVLLCGFVIALCRRRPTPAAQSDTHRIPESITPFTTLAFLRAIHGDQRLRLPGEQRSELGDTITRIESFYFAPQPNNEKTPDLSQIARLWYTRSGQGFSA